MKILDDYARRCGLRPALTLKSTRTTLRLELGIRDDRADFLGCGVSVSGGLTVQLIAAATSSSLAICSSCGHFFEPRRRRPAFGKLTVCREVVRAAALRS